MPGGLAIATPAARRLGLCVVLLGTAALVACREDDPPPPEVRPVRAIVVKRQSAGEPLSLTGQVQAETEVALAFRIDGRLLKRCMKSAYGLSTSTYETQSRRDIGSPFR